MGFDLKARNKGIDNFRIDIFSWPQLLKETGAGYVLGYGDARRPTQYVYQSGNHGSPVSNDGYKVTAKEARMMATLSRGYVSVKKFVNTEWSMFDSEEKDRYLGMPGGDGTGKLYQPPVDEDWLRKIEGFAEFAENSRGFRIE